MKRHCHQLYLESLEERQLMATCHVTRLSDQGGGQGFRGDLRYCVSKVNSLPGADSIDFKVSGEINLTQALPDLSSDMDILGPGATVLTVKRNAGGNHRIFTVAPNASVRILGLTASNGALSGSGASGGGIYNSGKLTLINAIVVGNQVENTSAVVKGGGIYNAGTLTINNSQVVGNSAKAATQGASYGGGIYNAGTMTINDSSVSNNKAALDSSYEVWFWGGGIYNTGSLTINRTSITANKAGGFCGVYTFAHGGGIRSTGELTITSSEISYNAADGNSCDDSGWGAGGGLSITGTTTIINSTIAHNYAVDNSWEGSTGGGIYAAGPLTIVSSTIAKNNSATGGGDGIYKHAGTLTLRNTIVASNGTDQIYGGYAGHHNFIGGDPKLGTLQHNGGPTLTMALLPGSPAIDAGDNADAPEFDQRGPGFPRIVNGTIDIGAFEVQSTGAPSRPHFLAFLITAHSDQDELETIR